MSKCISKVATLLFAPVMMSASCFSCPIQVDPVYAAAPPSSEMILEQGQDCESCKKSTEKQGLIVDSRTFIPLATNVAPLPDRSVPANHCMERGHTYTHANFAIKQFEPTIFHHTHASIGDTFDRSKILLLKHRPYFDPQFVSPQNNHFLIGTIIKKE